MFQHIKQILSNYKLLGSKFWLLFICAIVDNGTELALPYIIKHMYEIINSKGLSSELWKRFGLGILVLIIVEIGSRSFRILYHYLWQDMSNKLSINYRSIVKNVEISRIHNIGTGKLLSKFEQGISAQTNIFFEIITSIIAISIRGMGVIIAFALYAPQLIWVLVSVIIIFAILEYYLGKRSSSYTDNIRSTGEEITKLNVRYFSEFLMIKIHNNFNQENQSYQKTSEKLPYRGMMQEFYSSMKYSILYLGLKGAEILTVAYLGSQLLQGQDINIATIIMLAGYLMRARRPIEQATHLASTIQKQLSKYIELQQFITQPPTITNGTLPYHYHRGDISFNQVRFGYHTDNILFNDFNLTIAGGSKVALVGHSGSGKSTLIKLILRLYDIQGGTIMIDNQELTQLDITSVYDHIGYLTQEPAIFDGTVRQNLIYGVKSEQHTTDQQLIEACKLAMFDIVLDKMKDGLDTMVGERGIKLSGGEKQRLAIARLFLKNPNILILDEPTAALDSISEYAITKALEIITAGRTTIIIAHRLQTVMNTDRIIVMDHGQIIQSGTHDQLVSQEGMYRSLVNLQSGLIEE